MCFSLAEPIDDPLKVQKRPRSYSSGMRYTRRRARINSAQYARCRRTTFLHSTLISYSQPKQLLLLCCCSSADAPFKDGARAQADSELADAAALRCSHVFVLIKLSGKDPKDRHLHFPPVRALRISPLGCSKSLRRNRVFAVLHGARNPLSADASTREVNFLECACAFAREKSQDFF